MLTESTSNTYKELHIGKKKKYTKHCSSMKVLPKHLHCQLNHVLYKVNHFCFTLNVKNKNNMQGCYPQPDTK